MKKQMIELFSGSKHISETFEKHGWNSFSVDNNPKLKPRLCCDILNLDLNQLPSNPDFIWASPDCSKFSRAANQKHWIKKTTKYRIYDYTPNTPAAINSLALLEKTVFIINSYAGVRFIIENPIGRIQHMDPLKFLGHYRYYVNYADFGFPYSKKTYLFSNIFLPFSTKKITSTSPGLRTVHHSYNRSLVPQKLIETIIPYIP